MIFTAPRFVVVDDKVEHINGVLDAFQHLGSPCIGLHYDPEINLNNLNKDHFRAVRCLFLDLHLMGGQLGTDHKGDYARIQSILEENISEHGGPFVLVMWTAHPHLKHELIAYLDKNLDPDRPHARPLVVTSLAKETFIDLAAGTVRDPDGLSKEIVAAVTENPQLAALLGWENDVLAAAGDTLASLINLVPADQRKNASFAGALDTVLSRLAREAVGSPNVEVDHRSAINSALAPILNDRIMNQSVTEETKDLWKKAVTCHDRAGLASASEAGQINRMMHLSVPSTEKIRATDWGAVVAWPFERSDDAMLKVTGLPIKQMLCNEFRLRSSSIDVCKLLLVRIGAACDYAQNNKGPITFLFAVEIPEGADRQMAGDKPAKLSDAIWRSPVFAGAGSTEPSRLYVHIRFPMTELAGSCAAWTACYRLREQLLMNLISSASSYGSRPGIVQLPVM